MAFEFRLAVLLRHRRRVEEERARDLARAVRRREQAARRLAALESEAQAGRQRLHEAGTAGASSETLRTLAGTVDLAVRLAAAAARDVARDDASVAQARAALIAARRERQVLERLEALHREAYEAGVAAATARELDEIAARQHHRARRDATELPR